jgi:ABC-type antimicrobial peptide transport system permease subunit
MLRGLRSATIGVLLGLVGAVALSRLFAFALWEVRMFDPISFGIVAMPLLFVALLASWLPARRVTRADPMSALRSS